MSHLKLLTLWIAFTVHCIRIDHIDTHYVLGAGSAWRQGLILSALLCVWVLITYLHTWFKHSSRFSYLFWPTNGSNIHCTICSIFCRCKEFCVGCKWFGSGRQRVIGTAACGVHSALIRWVQESRMAISSHLPVNKAVSQLLRYLLWG